MRQVTPNFEAPPGFHPIKVVGMHGLTGIKAELIEPISMKSPEDWREIVNGLQSWGEVPSPESVTRLTTENSERGIVAVIEAEEDWIAELLPWGSDGLLKVRSKNAPDGSDVPLGGYSWEDRDVIILRRPISKDENSEDALVKALQENDLESCQGILGDMGKCLGKFHSSMRKLRELPPDQKRWNSRNEKLRGYFEPNLSGEHPTLKSNHARFHYLM